MSHHDRMGWTTLADREERQASTRSSKGWQSFTAVVRRPHSRRQLTGFVASSAVKDQNSLIESWVDIQADMHAINTGRGEYDPGTQRVSVNGRTYGIHDNGRAYPVSGEGIIEVTRGTYKALTILRRYNGVNERSEGQISRERGITAKEWVEAINIWRLRERALNDGIDAGY